MKKTLLLSMPFGPLERQALGLSILKPQLEKMGIGCDIQYLTFPFAEFIGYENYQWISNEVPYTAFAGDWVFRRALYGYDEVAEQSYIDDILIDTWKLCQGDIDRIQRIQTFVPAYIDYCTQILPWEEYRIVGFTSTFEQNLASLAFAQQIKASYPHLTIVFGGANWEGEMGQELARQFHFIDYVCSGEADESFPALAQVIMKPKKKRNHVMSIKGLVWRAGEDVCDSGQAPPIRHMDALPMPSYEDYFENLTESTIAASVAPVLLIETSRGCWWGEKSHCTFCGLNAGSMEFRSKGAKRCIHELETLSTQWQIDFVEVVDNILDMNAFKQWLPVLADRGAPYRLFYEVKANLNKAQVQLLSEAGVYRIQPGIESMSDHILSLMRKGTTALRNIQLLKWCKEYGIAVDWNILYGFPGETAQDYEMMLSFLPSIKFLHAPTACGPIRLDRFSPYFNEPQSFGLTNVRPNPVYRYLYPFSDDSLSKIAYFFEYDYQNGMDSDTHAKDVIRYCDEWLSNPEVGCVWWVENEPGKLHVFDTRSDAVQSEYFFTGIEYEAYHYCQEIRRGSTIFRYLKKQFPNEDFSEQDLLEFLRSLCECRLMVMHNDHYLSLAIPFSSKSNGREGQQGGSKHHTQPNENLAIMERRELPMVSIALE